MKSYSKRSPYPLLGAVPAIGWTILKRGPAGQWVHAEWVICFAVSKGGIVPMVQGAHGIVSAEDVYEEYNLRFEGLGA